MQLRKQRSTICDSLSEREVDSLITSCNEVLARITFQHDELKRHMVQTRQNIMNTQFKTSQINAEARKISLMNEEYELEANLKQDVLQFISDILTKDPTQLVQTIDSKIQELQSTQTWSCIRCRLVQKEGENEESCIHHPGKLKYYSCRQCGQDEYFTCCNKCRDCMRGCTMGLHKK